MLQAHPPRDLNGYRPGARRNDPERQQAADALNAHVYWDGPLSDDLAAFYRKRIERALSEIEEYPAPERGVLLWKLYSSGIVIKSPEGVFAFDVIEGPVPSDPILPEELNTRPIPDPGDQELIRLFRYKVFWTPAMRKQYARVVDAHFVSHGHYDHFSGVLVAELLKAGKTVVAPRQVREQCLKWGIPEAETMTLMPQDRIDYTNWKEYVIHNAKAISYSGFQDEYKVSAEGDRLVWSLNESPHVPENNSYIVRLGGLNVMHNGDVRGCPTFYPWLVHLIGTPWQPDLCPTVPYFDRWSTALPKLFPHAVYFPIHELEMGHTRLSVKQKDQRAAMRLCGLADGRLLLWGERIAISPPESR